MTSQPSKGGCANQTTIQPPCLECQRELMPADRSAARSAARSADRSVGRSVGRSAGLLVACSVGICTDSVLITIDTFGRDPHISSNRQKKVHFCSNRSLIDVSHSSALTPHPDCSCIAFASFQRFFMLLTLSVNCFNIMCRSLSLENTS